jgi:WD40 repeat protein
MMDEAYKAFKPKDTQKGLRIVLIDRCSNDPSQIIVFKIDPSLYGECNSVQTKIRMSSIQPSDRINIYKIELQDSAINETPFKCSGEYEIELPQFQKYPKDVSLSYNSQLYECKYIDGMLFLLIGGYWEGMLRICGIKQKAEESTFIKLHSSTITALAIDSTQNVLITGSKDGDTTIWDIAVQSEKISILKRKTMFHHTTAITYIHIDNESGLSAIANKDGDIYIYEIGKSSILKAFSHPNGLAINGMAISECPYLVLTYFNSREGILYMEAMNSVKKEQIKLECKEIKQIIKYRNKNLHACLLVGVESNVLRVQFDQTLPKQLVPSSIEKCTSMYANGRLILLG